MLTKLHECGCSAALTDLGLSKYGNYKLHERRIWNGLKISIENRKNSRRHWKDLNSGEEGSNFMHYAYGYIRMTEGSDGDHLDVYLGEDKKAKNVYIVNQMKKPPGSVKGDGRHWIAYDEQKCMLNFSSAAEAKKAYLKQYNDARFFGSMLTMPVTIFKTKALRSLVGGRHKLAGSIEQIIKPEHMVETSSLVGLRPITNSNDAAPEDKIDRMFGPTVNATGNETTPAMSEGSGSEASWN